MWDILFTYDYVIGENINGDNVYYIHVYVTNQLNEIVGLDYSIVMSSDHHISGETLTLMARLRESGLRSTDVYSAVKREGKNQYPTTIISVTIVILTTITLFRIR